MNEWEEIAQVATVILDGTEAEKQQLCQKLMSECLPERLKELANQLKSQWFDRLLHTDLEQAQQMARFLSYLGEAAHNTSIGALGLLAQSDAALHSGQAHQASDLFLQAGEAFLQEHDRIGWARARGGWVVAATYAGSITEQNLLEMEAVLQVLRDAGPAYRYRLTMVEQNTGLAWKYLGNFQKALDLFAQAQRTLDSGTASAELELRGMLLANSAIIRLWSGDLTEAASLFQHARTLLLEGKSTGYVALTDMNLSVIERLRGHWQQTVLLLQSAIRGLREAKLPMQTALALIYQADLLLTLNRPEEAALLADEAITLLRPLEDPIDANSAYCVRARALYLCGNKEAALACLLEGASFTAQVSNLSTTYSLPLERAAILLACGNAAEAKEVALALLKPPETGKTRLHRQKALLLAAEAHLALGNITLARSMAQQVMEQGERFEVPELLYRGHIILARAAYQAGDLPTALCHFDRVTATLRTLQEDLFYDQRSEFLEDKDAYYLEAMLIALEHSDKLKAFTYLEQRRTRSFWRLFPQYGKEATDTDELESELSALLLRHRAMSESLLLQPPNASARTGARNELLRLARRIRDVQATRAQKDGTTMGTMDEKTILDLIPSGRTLLSYALTEEDLVIFVISRFQVVAERIPGGAKKLHTWTRYLELLIATMSTTTSGVEHWQGRLQSLWSLLIAPIAHHLPPVGEVLTIIPSGILYTLPWAMLYDGQHYLIERWELHCIPSCQAFTRRSSSVSQSSHALLALGYSCKGQLPGAPEEARDIATFMQGEAWTEEDATGKRLQQAGQRRMFLHIAAHAAFREGAPHSSFLQLADGLLHPTDVLNLDLCGCRLVTLSACNTGIGYQGNGDEHIGLMSAFHLAGAEAVLATLWRVDDPSTVIFMRAFYQWLAAGCSPVIALRKAQLACLHNVQNPSLRHPYFWAGFQLITYVSQDAA